MSAALWSLAVDQALLSSGYLGVYCRWRGLDLFLTATQIVAWYPACQQLAQAVNLRFPDSPAEAQVWLKDLKNHWWQGEVKTIIAPLQAAGLSAHYFEEQQRRMDYPTFNALGYPLGSGSTESGVKQYKQRLCGTGRRWSGAGLERMMLRRSAALDNSFADHWAA